MAKLKTTETSKSVASFIKSVDNPGRREDSWKIVELIRKHTGFEPKMWGPTIIGFGRYHYKYASGHEGDMPLAAFSPRSTALVFYFCEDFYQKEKLLNQLGKHKSGKCCVYVNKLSDIETSVLIKMIDHSMRRAQELYD